jgi:hypothetical protein
MKVTHAQINEHLLNGSWRRLQTVAIEMVANAEAASGAKMSPKLGGGTRLMLELRHRISDDIDLFIRDPQWIGYLSPRLNDRFEDVVRDYDEGSSALKLFLSGGEIDFIVGPSLLGLPDETSEHSPFALEPIGEILAKKLFYRGWAMAPRDLFDWWYASTHAPDRVPDEAIAQLLSSKLTGLRTALAAVSANPAANTKWDMIQAAEKPSLTAAAEWARRQLVRYELMQNHPPPAPTPPAPLL